uniref:BED-type domain-containing protein n=2 Tax=Meloidogyne TaxID=189290 RepID=A0A914NLM0_MELIC
MPSVVWDYFDEFEGGGKCRLCGCIRNRKDKSTSTFWQHLERVHGLDKRLMLSSSPANSLGEGKK